MESLCLCPDTGDPRRATRVRSFFVALAWRHSAVHMPRSKQDGRLSCRKEGSRGTGDNGGRWGKGGRIQAVGGRPVPTRIREHSKIITRARGAGRVILGHPRDKSTPPLLSLSPDHRPFQPPFSNSPQHPSPFPSEEYGSLIRFLPLAQPPVHLPPANRRFPTPLCRPRIEESFESFGETRFLPGLAAGEVSTHRSRSKEGKDGRNVRGNARSPLAFPKRRRFRDAFFFFFFFSRLERWKIERGEGIAHVTTLIVEGFGRERKKEKKKRGKRRDGHKIGFKERERGERVR